MTRAPVILIKSILIFILITVNVLILINVPEKMVLFVSIFVSIALSWGIMYPNIGSSKLFIEEDGFYFRRESNKIKYSDVESVYLTFSFDIIRTKNTREVIHTTNVEIKMREKRNLLIMYEEQQLNNFWPIIKALKEYNCKNGETIDISLHIPNTEQEFIEVIEGWSSQDEKVVSLLEKQSLEMYAAENEITLEEAEIEVDNFKHRFIQVAKATMAVMIIIGAIFNFFFSS